MSIYRPYHAAPLSLKAAPSDLYDASRDVRHTDKACNKRQNDISVYNLKETASNAPINSLTLTPRLPALNTEPYEHDGAGSLSAKGPRHNNDRDDITEIQILPTTDEIISLRSPYMPKKISDVSAPKELLEIHFRQLRHENIELILDACYDGLQKALSPDRPFFSSSRFESPRGNSYSFFHGVKSESTWFHDIHGAIFRFSFECPPSLRGAALTSSNVFEQMKMCALLAVHTKTNEVNVILCEPYSRTNSEFLQSSTATATRAAVNLMLADREDTSKVRETLYLSKELIKADLYLVDLPEILAAGFVHTLQRLQQFYASGDFPFSDVIAAGRLPDSTALRAPLYALKKGFKFDLSSLGDSTGPSVSNITLSPLRGDESDTKSISAIKNTTVLDDGQAIALCENLSRRLAFTQGPPGTGKTFLGAAECEVILKSQPDHLRKPIVVICMTNHALDDFVNGLIKREMTKIIRVGSRSAAEWAKKYSLHTFTQSKPLPHRDKSQRTWLHHRIEDIHLLGSEWAMEITGDPRYRMVEVFLREHHPAIANEFSYLDRVSNRETDLQFLTRSSAGYAFNYWIKGGDLTGIASLVSARPTSSISEEDIQNVNLLRTILEEFKERCDSNEDVKWIWSLGLPERDKLFTEWLDQVDKWAVCDAFAEIHRCHQAAMNCKFELRQDIDGRIVSAGGREIIALTASGAARNWRFLTTLEPHTYLIEEASELIEASSIAALVPSVQHIIKIGDPYQLRPHVSVQNLCTEGGLGYGLDVSLFERVMKSIPFSKLNTQRRAHPMLSNLLRSGDYPYLLDHLDTKSRAEVPGMLCRMYWLDHKHPEDKPDPQSPMAKSFSNRFEVEFISAAVKYLIERQGFRMKKITILTAYNGQVAAFVKRLKGFCNVRLASEDRQTLVDEGFLTEEDMKGVVSTTALELSAMLRIASIDSYQGEENDVVFFSPVRSNPQNKGGFLKNQNRINVAISRARNGFYVVGDASLLSTIPSWEKIVKVFSEHGLISTKLPVLPCSKHSIQREQDTIHVASPKIFQEIWACRALCTSILPCGHTCSELCHPEEMHEDGRIRCKAPCGKVHEPCQHKCTKTCAEECGSCSQYLGLIVLPCGHGKRRYCSDDISSYKCEMVVRRKTLDCGHRKEIICSSSNDEDCAELCERFLPCGHKCTGLCYDCTKPGSLGCGPCTRTCDKTLECGHQCSEECHEDDECPPCEAECEKSCPHGKCRMRCSVACDPCIREGDPSACSHRERALMCCLPGSRIPCSEPCSLSLSCGLHMCPGLCGELCPKNCQECLGRPKQKGFIILPCQHTFEVQEMDKKVSMDELYELDISGRIIDVRVRQMPIESQLQCPVCDASTFGTPRYALAHQLLVAKHTIGRLYAKLGRHVRSLMTALNDEEDSIVMLGQLLDELAPGPTALRGNIDKIHSKKVSVEILLADTIRFLQRCVIPVEEAIVKFCSMVKNPDLIPVPAIVFKMRFEKVQLRCNFLLAHFYHNITKHLEGKQQGDMHLGLLLDHYRGKLESLPGDIAKIKHMLEESERLGLKRLHVELTILLSSFFALARMRSMESEPIKGYFDKSFEYCREHRKSAGVLVYRLREAQRKLGDGIASVQTDDMYDGDAKQMWLSLGHCEEGTLQFCHNKHPYCAATFKGCPECA